ncbi:MAG: restriction endonuclease [Desulfocapsaceae bacterium]|nr:restriction endonuclease [Desulfocapsaceae bacterium]
MHDLEISDWALEKWVIKTREEQDLIPIITCINLEILKYLHKHPSLMYSLKPRQFEELICEILSGFGWQVELTPATRDGGYDIFAISKDLASTKTSWLIECKRYAPERKVGIDVVRSLCGVKNDLKAANAMIATTSFFTKGVLDSKNSRYDLELKDYNAIVEWLKHYK